jgi:hypothetical protein
VDCITVDEKLRLQISVFRNTIVKAAAQGAICGICSTDVLGRIGRPIRHKAAFARSPTKHHIANRNFLMKPACFFMVAAQIGVDWFVLRGCDLA